MPTAPTASPSFVALASWVVPGSGYWMIGQRSRGLTIGITIVVMFLLGMLIGGVRVVEAPDFWSPSNLSLMGKIAQKPWFIGQVLVGPLGVLSAYISHQCAVSTTIFSDGIALRDIVSHARVAEIGTLYTAIAGMLNLLAIIDSAFRAIHLQPQSMTSASASAKGEG